MKHAATTNKQFEHVRADTEARARSETGIKRLRIAFRVSFALTIAVIFLIGLWAVLALVSAAVGAGGVLELIQGWFGAVTG